jgi:dolichyl-phosphate-mannose-protein mannosyltransferase
LTTPFYDARVLHTAAVTFLYLMAIFGWGELVCACLVRRTCDSIEYVASRVVCGCFGLYTGFVLLSLVGLLKRTPVAVLLGCGVIAGIVSLRGAHRRLRETFRGISGWPGMRRALFAMICVLAILQMACGLTPLILYDSQIYQLLAPVQFLHTGTLARIPWNVLTNAPLALQLTFGMSWITDPSGGTFKLLLTIFGCLLLLAAARVGGELGPDGALMAPLFVACYPEFWLNQAFGVVDLATAAFLLFGLFWWRDALRDRSWQRAVQAGIAFGFVLGSRYQGILFVALVLFFVLFDETSRNRKAIRQNAVSAAVVVAVACLMVAPWLVRNYSNFGNPFYPLLHNRLGGAEWSASQAARFQYEVMGPSLVDISLVQQALAPVSALLMVPSNGLFGFALLLGSMLALWAGSRDLRISAIIGITGTILWGLMHPAVGVNLLRFNAAGLVLMLSCTGAVLGSNRLREWKAMQVSLVLALGSLIIGLIAMQQIIPVWQTLTNSNARTLFWRANVPSWQAFEFANQKLDASRDKILLIGESRGLWLEIPFIAPTAFNGPQLDQLFALNVSSEEWIRRLHELRITYLLISFPEWERFQKGYNYFKPTNEFNLWLRTLPVVFDDQRGTLLLSVS